MPWLELYHDSNAQCGCLREMLYQNGLDSALHFAALLKRAGATQEPLFGGVGDVVNNIYPLCLAHFLRDDNNNCNETS